MNNNDSIRHFQPEKKYEVVKRSFNGQKSSIRSMQEIWDEYRPILQVEAGIF